MNAAHVQLCLKNRAIAMDLYKFSFSDPQFNAGLFITTYEEDIPNLIKYNIDPEEIPLIIDHILFSSESLYCE